MNKALTHFIVFFCFALLCINANAQNIFPATGRVGIGTTTPATLLQVKGTSRFGSLTNYANIDTGGSLIFNGTAAYKVSGNRYVFRYTGTQAYGLYFNLTSTRYDLRDTNGVATVMFGANDGSGVFKGGVKIGNSTSTTAGTIRYTGSDFQCYTGGVWKSLITGNVYTAGTGINIAGNTITNSAPDKIVTITSSNGISVTGTYPNFAIGNIATPWFVTGNAGTNPAVNFIGTTDAQPLVFKVNNTVAGYLDYDASKANTSFGVQSLASNATGKYNTANGTFALFSNVGGNNNTAQGSYSLLNNTTGAYNTANGSDALHNNKTGNNNTANGAAALYFDTTGSNNTATGYNSLYSNNTGNNNVATGYNALYSNTNGISNVATGTNALASNTQGSYNAAYGENALYSNNTGIENTASGFGALYSNQGGNDNAAYGKYTLYNNTTGNFNTALGWNAMFFSVSGSNNTATGAAALQNNGTGSFNSAYGNNALYSNNGGSYNVANGNYALYNNTSGIENVAVGDNALAANSSGSYNTATGGIALFSNTANYNTATGYGALYANSTGSGNTGTGGNALYNNITGYENTANGYYAMYANTNGYQNSATGDFALSSNNAGYSNVAHGYKALYSNTAGNNNSAVGYQALWANTSGRSNSAFGSYALYKTNDNYSVAMGDYALYNSNGAGVSSVAAGSYALYNNTDGIRNIAIGWGALEYNSSGDQNIGIGSYILPGNQTGSNNTMVGAKYLGPYGGINEFFVAEGPGFGTYYPGATNVNYNSGFGSGVLDAVNGDGNTGMGYLAGNGSHYGVSPMPAYNYCTYLGCNAQSTAINQSNSTAIGNGALVDASNKMQFGNNAVTSIGGQVGWTSFSDGRFKKNIKEDVKGLAFINGLKPITYTVDVNALNAYNTNGKKQDSTHEKMKLVMQPFTDEASKIVYNGFIAQDVEAAAKKINYNFSGVDRPKTVDGLYGLRYGDFVVPLVKAVQELSKQNDSLKTTTNIQQQQISLLLSRLDKLEQSLASIQQCSPCNATGAATQTHNTTITDGAALEQNTPNPFTHTTNIGYTLPQRFTTAQIMITDKTGKTLKVVNVSGSGKGSVNVDASVLASGAYNYSLLVDGKLIGTKQMVLAR